MSSRRPPSHSRLPLRRSHPPRVFRWLHLQFIVLVIFVGILLIVDFMFLSEDTFVYDPVSRHSTAEAAEQGGCSARSCASEGCIYTALVCLALRFQPRLPLAHCVLPIPPCAAQNYKSWGIKTGSSY